MNIDFTAKTTERRERGARRVKKCKFNKKITLLDVEQAKNLCGLCVLCVKRPCDNLFSVDSILEKCIGRIKIAFPPLLQGNVASFKLGETS